MRLRGEIINLAGGFRFLRVFVAVILAELRGSDPSSETQGLLAGTMRYFRASDSLGRKFTLSAEEPLGTYSLPNQFQNWSNSVPLIGQKNIFLPKKIFFCPISEEL